MIKGVLIYKNESGIHVYSNYNGGDISLNKNEFSTLVHIIRGMADCKERIENLRIQQFVINSNNEGLQIKDILGIHNEIHFHDDKKISGAFSVEKGIPKSATKKIFDYALNLIDKDVFYSDKCISEKSKKTLDDFFKFYMVN